jgi:hypothetical protein
LLFALGWHTFLSVCSRFLHFSGILLGWGAVSSHLVLIAPLLHMACQLLIVMPQFYNQQMRLIAVPPFLSQLAHLLFSMPPIVHLSVTIVNCCTAMA